MLDYPALAAIAAVIREGSFERAADTLGITPSAVSQRVRGYEERLGTILIVRGQPCAPTDLGRTLCAHFDRVQLLEADLTPALAPKGEGAGPPLTLKVAVNADSLATWFPQAAATFAQGTGMLLDLMLEDEAHTADRLRSGEVQAAVTADPEPVQGCKTILLGALRYAACASPDFMARHFSEGVNADTLAKAPHMRFDRRDALQARWAQEAYGVELRAPTHWVPSTQGFLDLCLAGLAWGLQPVALARSHMDSGRLVELPPALRIEVRLYWNVARLYAASLRALTDAVRRAASERLHA
ncbi:ArgP/LysG family DNA-binding transcriptional regulator [Sphingomonas oleivorans]|uniref:ArgP/LysG family DNA-binding transcriptional regulator n=1 Tax=Sphingomonas oleivorans TaxID=1735121 RepID=A0A2T5FZU5_9SPHN|nr:LysR family transcriptional regulator ArgP [Sphingomonas oleivorans]PTQ12226.1 ArgP/LysG family DNA-binding transcriptional regulator [Sphingomonas oleivorans]